MKPTDLNARLVEDYLAVLKHLSLDNRLELVAKLTRSIQADIARGGTNSDAFGRAFGAWEGQEDAQALADQIRSSRQFGRQIEEL